MRTFINSKTQQDAYENEKSKSTNNFHNIYARIHCNCQSCVGSKLKCSKILYIKTHERMYAVLAQGKIKQKQNINIFNRNWSLMGFTSDTNKHI